MDWIREAPVLIVDAEINESSVGAQALDHIMDKIAELDLPILTVPSCEEGMVVLGANPDVGCVLIGWLPEGDVPKKSMAPEQMIDAIRRVNEDIPIFLMTERTTLDVVPTSVLSRVNGLIWKNEDTSAFIAGHVDEALQCYHESTFPPFFKELVTYAEEFKYSWHTPGHSGGVAFLKSPAGRNFFNFMGENVLRSDLSVSVPELGSLMEHSGVVGEAEAFAARTFGADQTYFVTNGTSTANKIVWHGNVIPGDVVLADRNCHKSIMHAMIMTRCVPLYLVPSRNEYGIIGPIHYSEFTREAVQRKISECPLIEGAPEGKLRLAVVTNSTYDGLCYGVGHIKKELAPLVEALHFDEAWYGYARFHPMYKGRYGMAPESDHPDYPAIFATQSTHKLLAALSQGSMVHVRDSHIKEPARKVPFDRFNEAFMMHTSTSPQYGIIASLDVSTQMMSGRGGEALMQEAIEEAVAFRRKMVLIQRDLASDKKASPSGKQSWWFTVWQPDTVQKGRGKKRDFTDAPEELLTREPESWTLRPGLSWHGFGDLPKDFMLLDPIKVTVVTPGIRRDWTMEDWGIPAAIVTRFLWSRGIVVEKTGHYSYLVLFSMGVTKGKSGSLLAELFNFKRLYDEGAPLAEAFPELARENPERYGDLSLRELCSQMHLFLMEKNIPSLMERVYSRMPEQAMIPAHAYDKLVRGKTDQLGLDELMGRIPAVMVVPYPPGIPVIMPGERFTDSTSAIVDYLKINEEFDNRFPGFENECHGIIKDESGGKVKYGLYCLKEE